MGIKRSYIDLPVQKERAPFHALVEKSVVVFQIRIYWANSSNGDVLCYLALLYIGIQTSY